MLMKPPSIFDEVISQDSENYTVQSKQQSLKGKNAKKQNTIKIGQSNEYKDKSNERDNESVHSNGSKKSKGKKAKQSTLGRPKIIEGYSQRDEDAHSVHSTGSKQSHKSGKKENNIMQRPKIQQAKNKPRISTEDEISFKNAIGDPQESMIHLYNLESKESPKPIRYYEEKKEDKIDKKENKPKKYAPFNEIQHKYSSEEDIPIVRIQQPAKNNNYNVVGMNKFEQNRFNLKAQQKRQITQSKEYGNVQQSKSIFDQSKMGNTKSVRRPIFGRDQLSNNSKVSNAIDQSNVSGIDSSSRRKSNSKLRQLFNNSRQKNSMEQSNLQNESKMSSMGELQSQSRAIKPVVGTQNRMIQLQRKVIDTDNDNFGLDSIKSGLDLTVSNNEHLNEKQRDSLIFEFEPEKKKGMTVTSKNKKLNSSQQQLINLKGNLLSAKNNAISASSESNLPQIRNNNMISKDLKHVDKLLKENEEYLKNSGLLNLSSSDKPRRSTEDEFLFKIDDDQGLEDNNPWNHHSPAKQQPLNIKKVVRNEKYPSKQREKQEKLVQNMPIYQQIEYEQRDFVEQVKIKNEIKQKIKQPKQQRIQSLFAPEQRNPKPKRQNQNKTREQAKPKKTNQNFRERLQVNREEVSEEYIKSPGKILKNYDSSPFSRDDLDSKSEKSNKSAKKGKKPKQSAIPRDKTYKIQMKNEGPRCEESFYEEQNNSKKEEMTINDLSLYSRKAQPKQQKKPNVYHFSDEQNEINDKPKSRTDINFYDNEIRSNKPPSSRPPLSGKSGKSRSTSKEKVTKQTTIKINSNNQFSKNQVKKSEQGPAKKLTLMERAMMKHNQSQQENGSQQSFSSKQDNFSQNSRKSSNSRGSRKSIKENSIKINPKETNIANRSSRPPYQQKLSNSSSHQQEMQQLQRKKSTEQPKVVGIVNQRPIVSKNCTFIDEKGRLVQKDLVIKGRDIYGQSRIEDSTAEAFQRMKRTKENRRSRSKSRQNKNQRRRNSKQMGQSSSCQNSSYYDSFYQNSSYARNVGAKGNTGYNNNGSIYTGGSGANQTQALKQFLKPVEQVPIYNPNFTQQKRSQKCYPEQEEPKTFNDMFRKNQNQNQLKNYTNSGVSNVSEIRSRRSLKRTQTSASKR